MPVFSFGVTEVSLNGRRGSNCKPEGKETVKCVNEKEKRRGYELKSMTEMELKPCKALRQGRYFVFHVLSSLL